MLILNLAGKERQEKEIISEIWKLYVLEQVKHNGLCLLGHQHLQH